MDYDEATERRVRFADNVSVRSIPGRHSDDGGIDGDGLPLVTLPIAPPRVKRRDPLRQDGVEAMHGGLMDSLVPSSPVTIGALVMGAITLLFGGFLYSSRTTRRAREHDQERAHQAMLADELDAREKASYAADMQTRELRNIDDALEENARAVRLNSARQRGQTGERKASAYDEDIQASLESGGGLEDAFLLQGDRESRKRDIGAQGEMLRKQRDQLQRERAKRVEKLALLGAYETA